MMASVGALAQSLFRFPGCEDVKGTFTAAVGGDAAMPGGLAVIFLFSGALEQIWKEQPGKDAGNFGDPFGVNQYTEDMRMKEINNGRMAMISVLGIFGAELATGKDALTQFSALPSRSEASRVTMFAKPMAGFFQPANELGAMAPLGYFDPLGFAKVGDEAGFKNLRAAELKHGRVAMMASVGALAQSLFRFPGCEDVKGTFTAAVGGDAAMPGGLAVIFLLSGALEQIWKEQPGKDAGNFGDPAGLNQYTEEMRLKELNNGRMAMISVLGIFGAELATGKDALTQFS